MTWASPRSALTGSPPLFKCLGVTAVIGGRIIIRAGRIRVTQLSWWGQRPPCPKSSHASSCCGWDRTWVQRQPPVHKTHLPKTSTPSYLTPRAASTGWEPATTCVTSPYRGKLVSRRRSTPIESPAENGGSTWRAASALVIIFMSVCLSWHLFCIRVLCCPVPVLILVSVLKSL